MNAIKYTSNDYYTILNDLNNDEELKDKPDWFKRYIAGLGDMLCTLGNAKANNAYLRTAFTEQQVRDLCAQLDYSPIEASTSTGTLIFYLPSTTVFPITFNATDLKAVTNGPIAGSPKKFEARANVTASSVTGTFTYTASHFSTAYDFLYTGHKVRLTTTGTLPTGLSINTDYYVIRLSTTTFDLATSLANAYNGVAITITGAGSPTNTWTRYSFTAVVYQQETKGSQTIGQSDVTTAWQQFSLQDKLVLRDTLKVYDGTDYYTRVDTFIDSISTSKVYRFIRLTDDSSAVQFGNGVYGAIPPQANIIATYAVGGGINVNISQINKISVYGGANNGISGVSNPAAITGGSAAESIEEMKVNAPLMLKARDRFVTVADALAITYAHGGVAYADVLRNYYGILTARVCGIANGGGQVAAAIRGAIEDELIAKSVMDAIDVRMPEVTLTPITFTANVHLVQGYTFSTVNAYLQIACKMYFSEASYEISQMYELYTYTEPVALVNQLFSTTYTTADTTLAGLIAALTPRTFGEQIDESDIVAYIQSFVPGVDSLTVTAPTFPIVHATPAIMTHTGSTFVFTEV